MPRSAVREHDGERLFTDDQKRATETRALTEWKRTLDRCDGDGHRAARVFKKEQPALFQRLEESGKSFEQLCELASVMSGNDIEDGGYF